MVGQKTILLSLLMSGLLELGLGRLHYLNRRLSLASTSPGELEAGLGRGLSTYRHQPEKQYLQDDDFFGLNNNQRDLSQDEGIMDQLTSVYAAEEDDDFLPLVAALSGRLEEANELADLQKAKRSLNALRLFRKRQPYWRHAIPNNNNKRETEREMFYRNSRTPEEAYNDWILSNLG